MVVDPAGVLTIVIQMSPVALIGELKPCSVVSLRVMYSVYLRNELTERLENYFRRPYATSMQRSQYSE